MFVFTPYSNTNYTKLISQAKEEFHSQLAASRSQQPLQSNDLMDDNELLSDDRELDLDLVGKIYI
jgi:hypothetical protein